MTVTNKTREVVSVLDPAIDKHRTDLKRYISTRDTALLVLKTGMQPTRYFVRHIPTSLFNRVIEAAPSDPIRWQLAFQFGVVRVEGMRMASGAVTAYVPTGEPSANAGLPSHISDEQVDDFPPAVVQEIGQIVYTSCFLGQGSTVDYRLLPSLLSHLTAAVVRDAESIRPEPSSTTTESESPADTTPSASAG